MEEEKLCEYKNINVIRQIKEEFKLVNFLFPIKNINLFNKCQWPIPVFIFLIFKVVLALYTTIITIVAPCVAGMRYFVYLTNVSYTITAIYFLSSAIRTVTFEIISSRRKRSNRSLVSNSQQLLDISEGTETPGAGAPTYLNIDQHKINPLLKLSIYFEWMARHLAYCGSLIVTVGFYGFVAELEGLDGKSLFDINSHVMNSVIILIDLIFSASPVKLFHVIWVLLYGLIYALFTYIYYRLYNNVLYKVLSDWGNPSIAAKYFSLFVFVGSFASNLFIYFCYLLRLFLYNKLKKYRIAKSNRRLVLSVISI